MIEPNISVGKINRGPSVDGKFSRLSAVSCVAVEAEYLMGANGKLQVLGEMHD